VESSAAGLASMKDWPCYGNESAFFNITSAAFVKEHMPRDMETTCQFPKQLLPDPSNSA
jgi:hypothetical protein